MTLFADSPLPVPDNTVSWIVVAIAALTTFKNIADGVLSWLGKRDQLQNDHEMASMKMQLKDSMEAAAEAKEEAKGMQIKLRLCEEQHNASERDRNQLRDELNQIRLELEVLKAKSSTGKHKPLTHKEIKDAQDANQDAK